MKQPQYLTMLVIAATLIAAGCKKDNDDPVSPAPPANEEELITTVRLTFQSAGNTETKHFSYVDLDGDGGGAPVIEADTLSADTGYTVTIQVLNESEVPAEDITAEIQAEEEAHQFFFQPSGANVTVAYADADGNGRPVGLASIWTVGAASNGTITVTLRHEPDKGAAGVSAGDITNAGGETDIEVTFPLVID
ncbi:MAG: type 1 periplasmic binding fold superfamily protein [Flavobacteriales bacterium]